MNTSVLRGSSGEPQAAFRVTKKNTVLGANFESGGRNFFTLLHCQEARSHPPLISSLCPVV